MTEEPPPSDSTMIQRLTNFFRAITVEPVTLLLLSGSLLASTASQTLSLDKACRVNLNLSEEICDAVRHQNTDNNTDNERIVQAYVATFMAYKSILSSLLPCILLVFAGGWMDLTGRRKAILFFSVTGEILVQLNNLINVIFFYQLRVEFLILFEGFFGSFFGGWALMFLAVFSYISDITTEENRTYRLGLLSSCVFVGMPIGITFSGVLLKHFGYLTVYIVALLLAVLNSLYVIFVLSDPPRTKEHKKHDNRGFAYFLKSFFSPIHFLNSLRVVFRKTPENRASKLCILIAATCALLGPMYGESSVVYMSTRFRFGWDELQYSIYQAYNMILNFIGTLFCIIVISKKLGWHDSVLGIISSISKMCSAFVFCFAATGAMFYLGPLVDILNGTSLMAMRSIFSKSVEPHEIGKLNSIIGIFEVLMPVAYVPLFTKVYTATMEVLPGFVFLLGAFLSIPPLLVFIWLLYRHLTAIKSRKITESDVGLL